MTNRAWNLESFLDSFILELDRARDTLAVKGVNKPMTYSVKEVALDLQIFPEFDGEEVLFTTARQGQAGASKISIQLGSITDRQIRDTTKDPVKKDDISLEVIEDIDVHTKKDLQKLGINTLEDIENLENRNLDFGEISKVKLKTNYQDLASRLKNLRKTKLSTAKAQSQQLKRKEFSPNLREIKVQQDASGFCVMQIFGDNLAMLPSFEPLAFVNDHEVEIIKANASELNLRFPRSMLNHPTIEVKIILDPYAIMRFELK